MRSESQRSREGYVTRTCAQETLTSHDRFGGSTPVAGDDIPVSRWKLWHKYTLAVTCSLFVALCALIILSPDPPKTPQREPIVTVSTTNPYVPAATPEPTTTTTTTYDPPSVNIKKPNLKSHCIGKGWYRVCS